MYPKAVISQSEKFFRNKSKSKAFLLDFVNKSAGIPAHYIYEIQISLDLQDVMTSRIRKFKIYLTDDTSEEAFNGSVPKTNLSEIVSGAPISAVASVLSSGHAELSNSLINAAKFKKSELTDIDPKKFVDLDRYRNNFNGSATDKFGFITNITSYTEQSPKKTQSQESINNETHHPAPPRTAQLALLRQKVEQGLHEGVPVTHILDMRVLKKKSALSRHVITKIDQELKEKIKKIDNSSKQEDVKKEMITAAIAEYQNAESVRQRMTMQQSSSTVRTISFLLKITKDKLADSEVNVDSFGLLLEAEDKKGIILDRHIVPVSLREDLLGKNMTLSSFDLSITSEKSNMKINVSNTNKNRIDLKLFNKCMKKDRALYDNYYSRLSQISIPKKQKNAGFVIKKGRDASRFGSSQYVPVSVDAINVPNFFRLTPIVAGVNLDNMYELAARPRGLYQNRYVPIFTKAVKVSGKDVAEVFIDIQKIPRKIKQIKLFKRDVTKALRSGFSKNLEPAMDEQFREIGLIKIRGSSDEDEGNSFGVPEEDLLTSRYLSIVDFNVEPEKLYTYRVDLIHDVGRVEDTFSTSFFQEKIEASTGVASVVFNSAASSRTGDRANLSISISIQETDAEKVFKSVLNDKFVLFEEELKDIKDITTSAIAVRLERICVDDCTIDQIAYLTNQIKTQQNSEDASFNENEVLIEYVDNGLESQKSYVYKATACLKPISEIISGISEEITTRSKGATGASGKRNFEFASLRKRVANLDTNVLYTLASTFSASNSKGLIVDPETQAGRSSGNTFSKASTGDVGYFDALKGFSVSENTEIEKGYHYLELVDIKHFREKTLKSFMTTNQIRNKFLLEFDCKFIKEVDFCAIFMFNDGIYEHCCNLHVQAFNMEKVIYKALVEKENLRGTVNFYIVPVNVYGEVMERSFLGKITI